MGTRIRIRFLINFVMFLNITFVNSSPLDIFNSSKELVDGQEKNSLEILNSSEITTNNHSSVNPDHNNSSQTTNLTVAENVNKSIAVEMLNYYPIKKDLNTTLHSKLRPLNENVGPINIKTLDQNIIYSREVIPGYCKRQASCEVLRYSTCFGVTLPYRETSLMLVNNATNQSQIQRDLELWQGLRSVPRCWTAIQPLLCAVYMPRCENGSVDLPSQDLCRITRNSCRIVDIIRGWPSFLQCDHENFRPNCKNEWREVKFNSSAKCPSPLIETDHILSWLHGVEGCGFPCQNPFFTKEEHNNVRTFISVLGSVCLAFSLFTVMTFIIDWKSSSKYPALIIFYINVCFLIVNIGWLAQFTPGAREDIVCRKDGSLKLREPSSGENLSCVIIFVMVYYFSMAFVIWFVILTYSWFISFRALGKIRDAVDAKTAYFHLVAWSSPLILTITVLALGQIEGDSISGICFVGMSNVYIRFTFVVIPVIIAMIAGGFFLFRSLRILIHLKLDSVDLLNEKANAKINETIFRLGSFLLLLVLFVLTTIVCHLYEFIHLTDWLKGFRDYLECQALQDAVSNQMLKKECIFKNRPSIYVKQLHILLIFGTGVLMSSWIWTSSTVDTWKRFFHRIFRQPTNEPVKLKKHKMIAKAFAKRQDLQNGGVSVSYYSTHDDPLGMNFDLNSAVSQEVSSAWAASVPKFMMRRGGMMGATALGLRRNSSGSDMSYRRGSVEFMSSRRHSLDSQISMHLVEQDRLAYLAHARRKRRLKKKELRSRSGKHRTLHSRRRGSDVSQHSLPERKVNNLEKSGIPTRPSTAFNQPLQSQLPVLAPLRSHRRSLSGSKAADDLMSIGTSSGRESPTICLPGQVNTGENILTKQPSSRSGSKNGFNTDNRNYHQPYNTDNESIHNFGQNLSDAIMDAVWGSRVSIDRQSNSGIDSHQNLLNTINNPSQSWLGTKTDNGGNKTAMNSQNETIELNNLRQFPLLSRTALDLDGDSDIRESSSS